jgi:hypothetical protein
MTVVKTLVVDALLPGFLNKISLGFTKSSN